jgi:site-specific DNA-methyltransferase (adenine-specific)
MFSSASDRWATPPDVYRSLDAEFHFNFDPCPLDGNFDGLLMSWTRKRVFCNPPYGPGIRKWLERAKDAEMAVFLLPVRTDPLHLRQAQVWRFQELRSISEHDCDIRMSFDCKWFAFGAPQIDAWYEAYALVSVGDELRLMAVWCDANPKRAAHKKDWKRFANNWLKAEYRKKLASQKESHVGTTPVSSGVRQDVLERWQAKDRERMALKGAK